jgi:hypothetical protein
MGLSLSPGGIWEAATFGPCSAGIVLRGKLPLKLENFVVFFLAASLHSHRHVTPRILTSVITLKELDKLEHSYVEGSVKDGNFFRL